MLHTVIQSKTLYRNFDHIVRGDGMASYTSIYRQHLNTNQYIHLPIRAILNAGATSCLDWNAQMQVTFSSCLTCRRPCGITFLLLFCIYAVYDGWIGKGRAVCCYVMLHSMSTRTVFQILESMLFSSSNGLLEWKAFKASPMGWSLGYKLGVLKVI